MTKIETISQEISLLPDNLVDEVLEFIWHLKNNDNSSSYDFYTANESSLKDWLTVEEDIAWQNL